MCTIFSGQISERPQSGIGCGRRECLRSCSILRIEDVLGERSVVYRNRALQYNIAGSSEPRGLPIGSAVQGV